MTMTICGAVIGYISYKADAPLWENILRLTAAMAAGVGTYLVGKGII